MSDEQELLVVHELELLHCDPEHLLEVLEEEHEEEDEQQDEDELEDNNSDE